MNIYSAVRKLAKTVSAQNMFHAAKEMNGIKIFRNEIELSKIQQIYLSYLFMYSSIGQDIQLEKISEHVTDDEIYEDAYMKWKKERKDVTKKDNSQKDLKLVMSNTIKFPTSEVKENGK